MKIKKKLTTVEEIEVEISLPYYSKGDDHHYCILTENSVVQVWAKYDDLATVVTRDKDSSVFTDAANSEPCTEAEFKEHLSKAISLIAVNSEMLISVSELPEPVDFGISEQENAQVDQLIAEIPLNERKELEYEENKNKS